MSEPVFEFKRIVAPHDEDAMAELNALGREGWHVGAALPPDHLLLQRMVLPEDPAASGESVPTTAPDGCISVLCACGCNALTAIEPDAHEWARQRGQVWYLPKHGPKGDSAMAYAAPPPKPAPIVINQTIGG